MIRLKMQNPHDKTKLQSVGVFVLLPLNVS